VRRLYAEPGGLAASELVANDLQLDLTAVYLDLPVLRGVGEVRGYLDKSPWGTSPQFEPERYFDVDDERVLVFMLGTSTGRSSGVPVEARGAQEFTFAGDWLCVARCTWTGLKLYEPWAWRGRRCRSRM
jgi:hypothetical protein